MIKRFSIAPNSNHLIRALSEVEDKSCKIHHTIDIFVEPTRDGKSKSKSKAKGKGKENGGTEGDG
jgi:hypothetical protein